MLWDQRPELMTDFDIFCEVTDRRRGRFLRVEDEAVFEGFVLCLCNSKPTNHERPT